MRPEDEGRDPGKGGGDEQADDHAREHELPPSTWAGRERAEAEQESEPGLTEEFDQIERELDADLDDLGPPEEGEVEEGPGAGPDEETDAPETETPDAEAPEAEEETPDTPEAEAPEAEASETEAEPEAPAESGEDAAGAAPGETVEAETVGLADREQAEESALAGLRERAEGTQWDSEAAAVGAGLAASAEEDGKTPKAKPLWARFLLGSLLIVVAVASATSISLLVYLTDIAEGLDDDDRLEQAKKYLTKIDGGEPQNLLIIGSDERLDLPGDRRSDTTILLRVDPDQQAISLLSIPRDLRVSIPGHGINKFNAAYSFGNADLTLRTVKNLTGLEINHLVNINFTGFADAVNAIDCVYVDVDRRYYIPEEDEIAEIDIEAGYQRLCGYYALQYVRYRHDDNDLVRAARQQDFLREARQNVDVGRMVRDAGYRNELVDIFTDHTTSDIDDAITLLELLKTFFEARDAELREVHFPADLGDGTTGYVTASEGAIQETVATFMGAEGTPGPPEAGESEEPAEAEPEEATDGGGDGGGGEGGGKSEDRQPEQEPEPENDGPAMEESTSQGERYANQISRVRTHGKEPMVEFPIFYPTSLVPGSLIVNDTRAFPIDGPGDDAYRGYKMVVSVPGQSFGNGLLTEYYGISGTNWEDPPILANPSDTIERDGRTYDLFYDADRLRLVAWHDKNDNSYWINNSLSQSLSEEQLLAIAVSMRQLD